MDANETAPVEEKSSTVVPAAPINILGIPQRVLHYENDDAYQVFVEGVRQYRVKNRWIKQYAKNHDLVPEEAMNEMFDFLAENRLDGDKSKDIDWKNL